MNKSNIGQFFGRKDTLIGQFKEKELKNGYVEELRYIYVDNKAPVLLVAHMDTVQKPQLRRWNTGSGFDDRLGCFLGHQLVNKYPQYFDLLITDFEETCHSTGEFFEPSHDYNFIIELDREGEDFVDYGLCCDEMLAELSKYGFEQGWGSYSDIVELDMCPCSKINLGIGIYNSHDVFSWYVPKEVDRQLKRLMNFVVIYKDQHFKEGNGLYYTNWRHKTRYIGGGRIITGYGFAIDKNGQIIEEDDLEEIPNGNKKDWEEFTDDYQHIRDMNQEWDVYHGYQLGDN